MSPSPSLLTTEEIAALLHVHPKHVYRLLRKGLPARRVGSEWRFERDEVMQWAKVASNPAPSLAETRAAVDPIPQQPMPAQEPAVALSASSAAPSLVTANGDLAVLILLRQLQEAGLLVGFVQSDRNSGIQLLESGRVLAAGCHAGGFPTHVGAMRVARIHLVTREVGLAGRPGGKPPRLADLRKLRLASRPPSAGVRTYLDRALVEEGLDPAEAHTHALTFGSHLDVACALAAGKADAGLVSRAWSARMGLPFTLLAKEAYGLIVRARDLGDPRLVRMGEIAQSDRYRQELSGVAGYDATGAGDIKFDA
jgi:excisionase family DNA binding protein